MPDVREVGPVLVTAGIRAFIRHVPPRGRGIRLAQAWTRRHPPGDRVFASREPGGARLRCDLRDELSRIVYYRGWMDRGLERWMRAWLRTGDRYVDVGAHIGYLTALAAQAVGPSGHVLAFEPSPDTYARLSDAFHASSFPHVEAIQAAVTAEGGAVKFYVGAGGWSHQAYRSSLHDRPGLSPLGQVPAVTLDDVLAGGHVRLLKIDVEGGEQGVIEGGRRLLGDRRCDALVVELNPGALASAGSSVSSVVEHLTRFGYRPHRVIDDGSVRPWWPVEVDAEFADAVFLPG